MARHPPVIRKVTEDDFEACTLTLAAAFDDDPLVNYMLRQDDKRLDGLRQAYRELILPAYVPQGESYMASDESGVALWSPPPGKHVTTDGEWATMRPLMRSISGRRAARFERVVRFMEERHPDEHHAYLFVIGVHPRNQGKGIGSALLQRMTERLDRDGTPAYLESTKEINVPLYERHGFQVMDMLRPERGAPPYWRMWRNCGTRLRRIVDSNYSTCWKPSCPRRVRDRRAS